MAVSEAHFIITRPDPYANELATALSNENLNYSNYPLIEFVGNQSTDKDDYFSIANASDLLIFVSQQAVNYYLRVLSKKYIVELTKKTVIAIGKATQETLSDYGLDSLTPKTSNSEGVLALIKSLDSLAEPAKILLICGNDGRKLLEESLSKHHQIERLETYQRIGIAQKLPIIDKPKQTAIIVTSEQLLNLSVHQLSLQQTPQMQTSDKSLLQSVAFICASSRIVAKAKELGIVNCQLSEGASNTELLKACIEWQRHLDTTSNLIGHNDMSESEQHDQEIIEALELDQEPEVESIEPKKKKGGFIKPLFWLLVLAGVGYGSYWLWKDYLNLSGNSDKSEPQLERIVALEKQLKQQSSQISDLLATNQSQQQQNSTNQQELDRQIESLQQQLVASQRKFQSFSADAATQARDWQVAEAEYLVRQAAQKVHYSDDTASIIALLEAADQQILASGDTNLLGLRRAISQDIAQIKSHVAIDIDGILVKLDTIQSQLPSLTLASVTFDSTEATEVAPVSETEVTAWSTFKSNIKETFSDYYKVHNYDQSVKPFISPQRADLLKQNILLSLKTAQLSALRHQQTSYDDAIAEIHQWINEFYLKDQASITMLEQIKLLKTAKVAVNLPTKLQSIDFIKANNQERLNQWLQSPTLETETITPISTTTDEEEQGSAGDIDKKIQDTLQRMESSDSDESDATNDQGDQ